MSKCWYCNEELTTANYCDEHIGICTKCYNSMFKVSNEFVKGLTDRITDLEAKLAEMTEKYNACQEARKLEIEFNQQDKAELKQQLAESEKKLKLYPYKNDVIEKQYEDLKDAITFLMLNNIKDQEQLNYSIDVLCEKHKARIRDIENSICSIEQLKQQLAELQGCGLRTSSNHNLEMQNAQACIKKLEEELLKQEKEYDEQLLKQAEIHKRHIKELNEQLAEKEKEIANKEKILVLELKSTIKYIEHCEKLKYHNGLKNIKNHFLEHLKEYENGNFEIIDKYHNQEKIKFAVEQLEKVKNRIESTVESIYKRLDDLNIKIVCESTSRQLDTYEEIVKEIDNQIAELKKEGK